MDDGCASAASPDCFLSLVIPAYQEADGIAHAVAEADDALRRLGVSYEILVVDDGSRDGTAEVVLNVSRDRPGVKLLRHSVNCGYGAALRTGFSAARGERIAFTDADCQFYLDDLALLLPLTETYPVAVGYRVDRQDTPLRKFYSRGYNLLARTLLGTTVRDIDCALKVFRRDALPRILPVTNGFFVNTEMLTKARQQMLAVAEVGVRHRPRLRGTSKVSLHDIPRTLNALLPFWWSRVLFAGASSPAADRPRAPARGALLLLLVLMACALFLGRLHQPLLEPEEARYAEIPRQMLAEGRFLNPVLHGEDYYQKPPLLYWLVMASYQVCGVHDWAARLVPALAGVLTVLLTTLWGWRSLGFWAGFVSGTILCLSARFLYLAGMLTFDGLLGLWVVLGLMGGHLALLEPGRRRWWGVLSAVACGLGVLTKGPVALALVGPPLLLLAFLDRRASAVTLRGGVGYLLLVGLVAGPWYVAAAWDAPHAAGEFFWLHNVVRYLAPFDHAKPVWFYLPSLCAGALPWSLLLVPLLPYLLRRSARAGRRRPAALGGFVLAFTWCVMFFSLSGCKRASYIVPAFPLLALVLGTYVTHGLPWSRWVTAGVVHRLGQRLAYRLLHVALGLGLAVGVAAYVSGLWGGGETAVGATLLVGGIVLFRRPPEREPAWRAWAWCGSVTFALLLVGLHGLLPDYHQRFALRRQVREQVEFAREGGLPITSYPKRYDSISFYLQRDVDVFTPDELKARGRVLLFVKRGGAMQELLMTLPEGYVFEPRGEVEGKIAVGVVRKR